MVKYDGATTVQKWTSKGVSGGVLPLGSLAQTFLLSVAGTLTTAPKYWSRSRDEWLSDFWKTPGCDLLAGAVSTLTAKIAAAGWYVEGPLTPAIAYRDLLLHRSNFGDGWDPMVQQWATSFIDRDAGGLCENLRSSRQDHDGPALGFAHLDESKCYRTGDVDYPIVYDDGDELRKIHRSQVMRIIDMANPKESLKGVGFCGVGRAITTALIMMDIIRYKRERLSDLPPAGLLILSNLTDTQWDDVCKEYDVRQRNEGNTTWRDIMVLCGIDPSYKTEAELFEFSRLPEHYDERTATEIAIYTFALALRVDPREFWPVSAGPLGTATEAEIQHRKAKAKGEGIIFAAIERQLNGPYSLPRGLKFKFDFRDDEDDERKANIDHKKLQNVRLMWETSPNRGEPEGIITTEEARRWAVRLGVIPPDIVGETLETESVYDVRIYGPSVRAYSTGAVVVL